MNQLASTIKSRLDILAKEYARRLQEIKDYARLPTRVRLDAARYDLNLVATCLEVGDDAEFTQFIEARVGERLEQGFVLESLLQALAALEESLLPLVNSVEAAKFLWCALSEARSIISQRTTEKLLASEIEFRQIVDRSPVGIFRMTPEGRITEANPAFLGIVGYDSLASINEVGASGLYHDPADCEKLLGLLEGGAVSDFETRFRRPDGQIITVSINARLIGDKEGSPQFLEGIIEDVTERKRAEERVKQSQKTLQTIFDSMPFGVIIVDKDKRIRHANNAALASAGYRSEEQIVGMVCHKTLCPAEEGRCPIYDLGQKVDRSERILVEKDGKHISILKSVVPVTLDGQKVLLEAFVDITERKRVAEALKESEARFRDVALSMSDWVWEVDSQGRYTYCSERVADVLGYTAEEILGKTPFDLMPPDEAARVGGVFGEITANKRPIVDLENWNVRKDGCEVCLLTNGVPMLDAEGNLIGYRGVDKDITERKQLESEREEMYERRAQQVQLSTQVAQQIAAAPALEELFRRVVTLVKERFDYYHVQIFRHDPALDAVVLVAGYGEIGGHMLTEGHLLEMGHSVAGTAAATGQPVLATDITQDADWVPNPHLPETKGELAVPIKWRDEMLGILDVQSNHAGALTTDDQLLLEGLCGQIAIAIESTRLLEETNIFRRFAEASGQGFGMADLEGNVIYVNPMLCRMLDEVSPENVIGKSFVLYYPAEQQQRLQNEILPTVMQAGQWMGELTSRSARGRVTPTIENFFLIRDEKGTPRYLAKVVTDITERKRTEAEMADRLRELSDLYRAMSHEGWETFRETTELPAGYLFDRIAVEQVNDLWVPEMAGALEQKALVPPTSDRAVTVAPLSVRGEIVGALGVYDDPQRPLSLEDLALVEAVSEQVGLALESARLFDQTRAALARIEVLYTGSDRVIRARTVEEVLHALIQSTALQQFDRASLSIFDHPWGDEPPPGMTITAVWERSGGEPPAPVGTYYSVNQFPMASLLGLKKPTVISDIAADKHIDQNTRDLFVKRLGMRGAVVLPFVIGGQSVGGVVAQAGVALDISEEESRQMATLADQAAAVVQNQLLFEQTQTALEQVQAVHQRYIRQSWQDYLDARARFALPAYLYDQMKVTPLSDLHLPEIDQALTQKELILKGEGDKEGQTVVLPISLRGQPIGALAVESSSDGRAWSEEEIALIESVATQLALAIDNARLLEQTQIRASRERLIREISDKIRGKTDLDTILQTTVMELGKVLGTSKAAVRLSSDAKPASPRAKPQSGES